VLGGAEVTEGAAVAGEDGPAAGTVTAGLAWADVAAGADFEQAVANMAVPMAATSSAVTRAARLRDARRVAARPRTRSAPGGGW
jgi:hypothetical protein